MFDLDSWQEVWHTITQNKMRSFMTAFGVFWGIFMLIVMSGSGLGLERGMSAGVKEFAANSMFMFTNRTTIPYKGFRKGRSWDLNNKDIEMLKQKAPSLKYISGVIFGWSNTENNVVRGDKAGTFQLKGYHPDYIKIDPVRLTHGRFINEIDIREKRKVCVIGEKIYNDLYKPGENPVGSMLKINGIYYTVVGASEPVTKNINVGSRPEETIGVPFSTLQQTMHMGDKMHSIALTAVDEVDMSTIEDQITGLVKSAHQVSPDDQSALWSFNVSKIFKTFQNLSLGISILIWIVGLGTLFAGVVGVSNIMLVTIRERTQEIGIRRALGAKPIQIITQIMCESLVLTAIAGLAGIICGVGLLAVVDSLLKANPSENVYFEEPQVTFGIALASALILVICGMIAGLLPSYRALQIKAIDALRDE
ncbi:MAG: ABC transporter permease [Bacteroidales bacterium]